MKKFTLSQEDRVLFRKAVRDLKLAPAIKPSPATKKRADIFLSDHVSEPVTSDSKLFFTTESLSPKLLRELRQGKIRQTRILDLHGQTIDSARESLTRFLEGTARCVRIIHGKGRDGSAILKNQVNTWLKQHPRVLAFCSAQPKDGGEGAVYVLLKRT